MCNLRYCGTNIAIILSHYRIIALSHYRIIIIINIIYCFKTIIIVIAYVHAGKTRGTARGVRRRWRRCRICVSLCRPTGRSCPLYVAGGAVCRGSVTGSVDGGARATRRNEGETRTRSEPTGVCALQPGATAGWMSYTTRRRRLSAVRGEFEKRTLPDDPLPHTQPLPTRPSSVVFSERRPPNFYIYTPSILHPRHRLSQPIHRRLSRKVVSGGGPTNNDGLPFSRDNNIIIIVVI